jgi:hypothetical protein
MDRHPDAAHDRRASDSKAQQSGGQQERLGQQVRQEDRLKSG